MTTGTGDARRYRVRHVTTYEYGAPMTDAYTVACLVPRPTDRQRVPTCVVELDPEPTEQDSYLDVFGNLVHQFGLHEPHQRADIISTSEVEVLPLDPISDTTPWEDVVSATTALRDEIAFGVQFMRGRSPMIDIGDGVEVRRIAARAFEPSRPIADAIAALNGEIFEGFEFDPHFSNVSTPLGEVLRARRGVCQDFAHLAVACARSVGLAARYVSGYIETQPPPGQPRLVGADASHAWCSVWTPKLGWVDFDPTNNHFPVNDHITVAWGRDYGDVTPVRGVMIGPGTSQRLTVSVDVQRF